MNKVEKKSYDILVRQGYLVEKPIKTKWHRVDLWGIWDLVAVNNHHIRFIQVSAKYFTSKPRADQEAMFNFPEPFNCVKEYWHWKKGAISPRIIPINQFLRNHLLAIRNIKKQCWKKKK